MSLSVELLTDLFCFSHFTGKFHSIFLAISKYLNLKIHMYTNDKNSDLYKLYPVCPNENENVGKSF